VVVRQDESDAHAGQDRLEAIAALVRLLLPSTVGTAVERVAVGVSTEVYRVQVDEQTLYVRVLPEANAGFMPEALVHRLARARGARVPEVIHVEECLPALGQAVMVTSAVPGHAVAEGVPAGTVPDILAAAGRDLALINAIPVRGYGWLRRELGLEAALLGEHADYSEWAIAGVEESVGALGGAGVLGSGEARALVRLLVGRGAWARPAQARLAHGDFDCTHIFQQDGHYAGIIDFGEIRGAEPTYDLGQFWVEHPELLAHLLAGYAEVAPLPADGVLQIRHSGLLIALRRLRRRLDTGRDALAQDVRAVRRVLAEGV
jgi:aminoglycoside phosphotransferase (APT) family kinase protein